LTSTLSRLDPIYPRSPFPAGHAAAAPSHGGDYAAILGMGPAQYAFFLALLSGLSLPVGAMLGVKLKPHDNTIARWIAVGAGALLFAVSVELYGHSIHSFSAGHTELVPMIILLVMSLFGSYLFTYLAKMHEEEDSDSDEEEDEERADSKASVNKRFVGLRTSKTIHGKSFDSDVSVNSPGKSKESSPAEEHQAHQHHANAHGTVPAHKTGRGLGAIVRQIEHHRRWKAQKRWAHLREAFHKYHIISFLQKMVAARKQTESSQTVALRQDSGQKKQGRKKTEDFWANMKKAWGDTKDSGPNPQELSDIAKQSRAAAMSMLIMLIVDGIPEGILMGFMAASGTLGFTFVLSLVIANFPEGFAGGQLMEQAGMPYIQIILAWAFPMSLTACGAGLACHMLLWLNPTYTGGHTNPYSIQVLIAATEGVAGGAMISGIASTMLPEAYERRDKKGGILGSGGFLCTFGFLLSFGIKVVLD